jgi:hypothetical protein
MADTPSESAGKDGTNWLRLLLMVAMAMGAIAAGRQWAINRADRDFEQRLAEIDRSRN